MAGLDLSGVAAVLSDWIIDIVEISVDNGSAGATLDPETGKLIPPAPVIVYLNRGAVLPQDRDPRVPDTDAQAVASETSGQYRLVLPYDVAAPEVRAGMKVRVTVANGTTPDPRITRRRFEVDDLSEVSSMHVGTFVPLKQIGVVP